MAYRFASLDLVEFAITPLSGYTVGPITIATFIKRNPVGSADYFPTIFDSALTQVQVAMSALSNNQTRLDVNPTNKVTTTMAMSSTTTFYLLAVTWAGTGTTPRGHLHDGTSWTHANMNASLATSYTISGTDRLFFNYVFSAGSFVGDAVCAGIKKANSADLTIETLSRTAWSAWTGFGFDWLIGFDTSLQSAGVLQDQASPGTGDQIAVTGTSVVADPAGWSWAGGGAAANSGFLAFA